MDTLTFISSLISALAWPVTVIGIVLVLKSPLVGLLTNLKRLKFKDAELDFEMAVIELKGIEAQEGKQIPLAESKLKLAELSPRGAILESWLELEDALASAAEAQGIGKTRPGGVSGRPVSVDSWALAQMLAASEKLSFSALERFQKLRQIRNKAVHVTDDVIRQEDAESFSRLVAELKIEVRNA
jgi:hypothetical protein